jgi:predicted secreted hydrolase
MKRSVFHRYGPSPFSAFLSLLIGFYSFIAAEDGFPYSNLKEVPVPIDPVPIDLVPIDRATIDHEHGPVPISVPTSINKQGVSVTTAITNPPPCEEVSVPSFPVPSKPLSNIPAKTEDGFLVPQPYAELTFPRSHGSHPDFRIEWWYLTGHLFSEGGRRFGYQATFFRTALRAEPDNSDSPFGLSQLYLTHMALTDPVSGRFLFDQRLARQGWDASADSTHLDIWNGPWSLVGSRDSDSFHMVLEGSVTSEAMWALELIPDKPLVRFGEDGTSRKGPSPEARSYYLSFTRLITRGTVRLGNETFTVEGLSWMDHEIASNQLDDSLIGWDWIAIQLNDGWEIKAYLLRQEDGSPSPFSACIWISPSGDTFHQATEAFTWENGFTWESPESSAAYPIRPRIEARHPVHGHLQSFNYVPLQDNQELIFDGSTYWEGAGRVIDASGRDVGSAYLELVGYAGPIDGLR